MKKINCVFRVKMSWMGGGVFASVLLALALTTTLILSGPAVGQTITSTVEGVVTDANGALVRGAIVKATEKSVETERTATTDADGFYRLPALPAGSYTITV